MRVDGDLFGFLPPAPRESEQAHQIKRVRGSIGAAVLAFVQERGVGGTFHGPELTKYVAARASTASASPDRILRMLRAEGALDYKVSRSQSLYQITEFRAGRNKPVRPAGASRASQSTRQGGPGNRQEC